MKNRDIKDIKVLTPKEHDLVVKEINEILRKYEVDHVNLAALLSSFFISLMGPSDYTKDQLEDRFKRLIDHILEYREELKEKRDL